MGLAYFSLFFSTSPGFLFSALIGCSCDPSTANAGLRPNKLLLYSEPFIGLPSGRSLGSDPADLILCFVKELRIVVRRLFGNVEYNEIFFIYALLGSLKCICQMQVQSPLDCVRFHIWLNIWLSTIGHSKPAWEFSHRFPSAILFDTDTGKHSKTCRRKPKAEPPKSQLQRSKLPMQVAIRWETEIVHIHSDPIYTLPGCWCSDRTII